MMEDAIWAIIEPAIYPIGGMLIALSVILSILFSLVDALRVDRFKLWGRRVLERLAMFDR